MTSERTAQGICRKEAMFYAFLIAIVIFISLAINLSEWVSISGNINFSLALYSYVVPAFSPFYLEIVYVIVSFLNIYVLLIIFVLLGFYTYSLFIEHVYRTRKSGGIFAILLPSFVLFLFDLDALCIILVVLSLIMLFGDKKELGIFLYGISAALNLGLIILLPLYLYWARNKIVGIFLGLLPIVTTLWMILYYVMMMDASISLWGGKTNSVSLFMSQILYHILHVFGSEEWILIISITAIIGTITGIIVEKIGNFKTTDKPLIVLFIALLELEIIIPSIYIAPLGIIIHIMFIILLLNSKMKIWDILTIDGFFALSSIFNNIIILAIYKIVLIVTACRFMYEYVLKRSEFSATKRTDRGPIIWMFNEIKKSIINTYKKLTETIQKVVATKKIDQVFKYSALYLASLIFLLYNFTVPRSIVFDEYHYVNAAREIIKNGKDPRIEHPPLVKYLIVLGIILFGDNSFGWRFLIIIISALTIPATFYIAEKLLKSKKVAIIATICLLLDPLFYIQSRLAMLDGPALAFSSLAVAALVKYSEKKGEEIRWLFFTGLFLGIAISCKMTALVPILVALTLAPFPKRKHETLFLALALIIVPSAVFALSYMPLFLMAVKIIAPKNILEVLILSINVIIVYTVWMIVTIGIMFGVYQRMSATQPEIESHAWEWILGWKPIRAYAAVMYAEAIYMSMILEMANPLGWAVGMLIMIVLGSIYVICGVFSFILNIVFRKKGNKYKEIFNNIKKEYDQIAIILLWGFFAWVIYLPASLAHWFYWYYTKGTNAVFDLMAQIVYALFKEGRPHYIFYVYHMLPPIYVLLAYFFEKIDRETRIPFSAYFLLLSLLYFMLIYPVISGAIWIQYNSITG